MAETTNKGKKKLFIILGGVLAALVAGALVLVLILNRNTTAVDDPAVSAEDKPDIVAQLEAEGDATLSLETAVQYGGICYVNGNKILTGSGSLEFALSGEAPEYMIVINEGASLTLDGPTINGAGEAPNGIYVSANAGFTLKDGSIQNMAGHGVRVLSKASVSGGTIECMGTNWLMLDEKATLEITGGVLSDAGENGVLTAADSKLTISGGELTGAGESLVYSGGELEVTGGSYNDATGYAISNAGKGSIRNLKLTDAKSLGFVQNCEGGELELSDCEMDGSKADFFYNQGTASLSNLTLGKCAGTAIDSRGTGSSLELTDVTLEEAGLCAIYSRKSTIAATNFTVQKTGSHGIQNCTGEFTGKNITINEAGGIGFYNDAATDADGCRNLVIDGFTLGTTGSYGMRTSGGTLTISNGTVAKSASYALYVRDGICDVNKVSFAGTSDSGRGVIQVGLSDKPVGELTLTEVDITGGARGISNNGTLTINSGSIHDNKSEGNIRIGAGINNKGTLIIKGGSITGNSAASSGGAIYNTGTVTISGGKISNNYSAASGGAIANKGILNVEGGKFTANTAANYGGALYNNTGEMNISGGSFSGNKAKTGSGGALYNTGSATITGGTYENNKAAASGGALANKGTIRISSGTFDSNRAENYGGAIFNNGKLTMTGGTLSSNYAEKGGGAMETTGTVTIKGGKMTGNSTNGSGGGFYNASKGKATITKLTVSDNSSQKYGGGIYNGGTLELGGAILKSNKALLGGGGLENTGDATLSSGTVSENSTEGSGGGVYNGSTATMKLCGISIIGNTAVKSGGGAYNLNELRLSAGEISGNIAGTLGGGINNSVSLTDSSKVGKLYITGGVVTGNTAGTNGNGINSSNFVSIQGGSVYGNYGPSKQVYVKGSAQLGGTTEITDIQLVKGAALDIISALSNQNGKITLYLEDYSSGAVALGGDAEAVAASASQFELPESARLLGKSVGADGKIEGFIASCKIGDTEYESIASALAAAVTFGTTPTTITLLSDVTVESRGELRTDNTDVTAYNVTLDLDGHTITCNSTKGIALVNKNGVLQVKNGTIIAGSASYAFYANNGATVSISDCKITGFDKLGNGNGSVLAGSVWTDKAIPAENVAPGRYETGACADAKYEDAVYTTVTDESYTIKFMIKDSEGSWQLDSQDSGLHGTPITLAGAAEVGVTLISWNTESELTGTAYNEGEQLEFAANEITLYGNSTREPVYTIRYFNGEEEITELKQVVIQGQSMTAKDYSLEGYIFHGWKLSDEASETAYAANASVTPANDMTLYASLEMTDAEAEVTISGKKTPYRTLAEVPAAIASKTGDITIKVLDNVTLTEKLDFAENADATVTLDLNGKTITTGAAQFIKTKVAFTIDDTSEEKSGKIIGTAATDKNGFIYNNIGKTFTIKTGTIEASGQYLLYTSGYKDGKFDVQGGYILNNQAGGYAICTNAKTAHTLVSGGFIKGLLLKNNIDNTVGFELSGGYYSEQPAETMIASGYMLSEDKTYKGYGYWIRPDASIEVTVAGSETQTVANLAEAWQIANSNSGKTTKVKLLKDATLTTYLDEIGKGVDIVLDLAGKTVSTNNRFTCIYGSLTIKDTSTAGTGKLEVTRKINSTSYGIIDARYSSSKGSGKFTLLSGTIVADQGWAKPMVTANNGSATSIMIKGGQIIDSTGTGTAVNVHNGAAAKNVISGGTIKGLLGISGTGSYRITGGTFTVDPSDYVPSPYVATNSDGIWTVDVDPTLPVLMKVNGIEYRSIDSAITAMVGTTDKPVELATVELQSDIETARMAIRTGTASDDKAERSITFNANGKTIQATDDNGFMVINSGTTVTITGDGVWKPFTTGGGYAFAVNGGSVVNVESGTFEVASIIYPNVLGTVNISGGNFTSLTSFFTEYDPLKTSANPVLVISGGTFNLDPTEYLADGYQSTFEDGVYTVSAASPV